ncbi:RNA-binding S4 domain-containing protein [Massilia sp. TS11]|uniref:RNA-binding S4 domain-containing protein n=1 Tax=Massilia sp. TS11 TaxID=2908003 RepID=UPI001EDC3993|nr:S4 domain-containing protein [Massilia sp. TS11]MCG2584996.1 RNA-binding S4 domain-containing protein [Massilia sp. TS11]
MDDYRIDKWLWAARFFKTRSLAAQAVDGGRVRLGGERIKPARTVRLGEVYQIDNGAEQWEVVVRGLSAQRGPATVARTLYEETADSLARRALNAENRRLFPEPGLSIKGRPTKRDRRRLDELP